MNKLRAMQLFVRIAELGSFSRAADELALSKSVLSKEMTRLETALGIRLLQRSTRRLELTERGQDYLQRCRAILAQVESVEAELMTLDGAPRGKLRVNASMSLGLTELSQALSAFMAQYPEIELDVELSDEWVDLITQGFDLGFRAASRPFDSSYVGRAVATFRFHVCAAPEYVARHPPIRTPADLNRHNCYVYRHFRGGTVWPIGDGVQIGGRLRANNTLFIRQAVLDGHGIAMMPSFVCGDGLASGALVELLADHPRPPLILYATYPARRHVPPKVSACVAFIEQWFAADGAANERP
jgi:DNA-binding transcriptional LysR family regulator